MEYIFDTKLINIFDNFQTFNLALNSFHLLPILPIILLELYRIVVRIGGYIGVPVDTLMNIHNSIQISVDLRNHIY